MLQFLALGALTALLLNEATMGKPSRVLLAGTRRARPTYGGATVGGISSRHAWRDDAVKVSDTFAASGPIAAATFWQTTSLTQSAVAAVVSTVGQLAAKFAEARVPISPIQRQILTQLYLARNALYSEGLTQTDLAMFLDVPEGMIVHELGWLQAQRLVERDVDGVWRSHAGRPVRW